MKLLLAISLLALTLTTGFTCSKNTPEESKVEAPATQEPQAAGQPTQEQMAQPPADGVPGNDSATPPPMPQPIEEKPQQ